MYPREYRASMVLLVLQTVPPHMTFSGGWPRRGRRSRHFRKKWEPTPRLAHCCCISSAPADVASTTGKSKESGTDAGIERAAGTNAAAETAERGQARRASAEETETEGTDTEKSEEADEGTKASTASAKVDEF